MTGRVLSPAEVQEAGELLKNLEDLRYYRKNGIRVSIEDSDQVLSDVFSSSALDRINAMLMAEIDMATANALARLMCQSAS